MTGIIDSKSKRRLSAQLATGLAISGLLVLGAFVASASADEHRGGGGRGYDRGYGRGYDRGYGRGYPGWGGPYFAPPLVYGSPYYYPPPVVYGPGIGIGLPGINVRIR